MEDMVERHIKKLKNKYGADFEFYKKTSGYDTSRRFAQEIKDMGRVPATFDVEMWGGNPVGYFTYKGPKYKKK